MSEIALVDTGFWLALFDPRDTGHQTASKNEDLLDLLTIVVPWPLLYETMRSRFVRRANWVGRLDQRLKKPNVEFIDDHEYRQEAYSLAVRYATQMKRPISMADMLCRLLIADANVRVDYLLTTNPRDFADVCRSNGVELL